MCFPVLVLAIHTLFCNLGEPVPSLFYLPSWEPPHEDETAWEESTETSVWPLMVHPAPTSTLPSQLSFNHYYPLDLLCQAGAFGLGPLMSLWHLLKCCVFFTLQCARRRMEYCLPSGPHWEEYGTRVFWFVELYLNMVAKGAVKLSASLWVTLVKASEETACSESTVLQEQHVFFVKEPCLLST